MKPSILVGLLLVLGVVAAAAAAALVVFLRMPDFEGIQQAATPPPEITVLAAARDLPPRTVLGDSDIVETQVPRDEAPANYFSNVNEVRGRMLAVPLPEGQLLTSRLFPARGSGYELAGLLTPGMRAVSVSLPGYSGLDGLLYPGSVVDVLASFSLSGRGELGTAVSTTLLENVQVLAVENLAVTSDEYGETETTGSNAGSRRSLKVTLMVDTEQAEALQLATEYGYVSLAMRNPRDEEPIVRDATLLNQGQLARFADVVGARHRSAPLLTAALAEELEPETETEPEPVPEPAPAPAAAPEPPPNIEVHILRGTLTETKSFSPGR